MLKNFSRHKMFLVISRCRKTLAISTLNQILLCNYFKHLLVYLYDLDVFLHVPGIRMNTLLNLLQVDFRIFPLFHFYSIATWPKVQNERNIHTNLNNCQNSCFCFEATKVNVKFNVNTQFHISGCSFFINTLDDLDCILTGLILKVCWPFASEEDLPNII